jgi:hypothetical protein
MSVSPCEAVTIEDTGMYYLWFVICDPNLAGVTVSGQTTWKNPGGRAAQVDDMIPR